MMNRLVAKVAIAVIAVPAMAGYSMWQKSKAIDVYQISDVDLPVMETCTTLMNAHNMEFSDDVPLVLACACMAKHATSTLTPAELTVFTETFVAEVDFSAEAYYLNYDDEAGLDALTAKVEKDYLTIRRKAGLSEAQFDTIYDKTEKFQETCIDAQTHKGETLARIAALTPLESTSAVENLSAKPTKSDAEIASMLR